METEPSAALHRVVRSAVELVPGAEGAAATVLRRGGAVTQACTGAWAEKLDAWQYAEGEGPCLDAVRHWTVRSDALADEQRWPRFVPRALALGVGSALSVPMPVRAAWEGSLNLYARSAGAFGPAAEQVAEALSAHAAVAVAAMRTERNLRVALRTRELVATAQGMLMERYGIGADEAFAMLAQVSQRSNRKLREVAAELNDTGVLPTREAREDHARRL